MPVCVEVFVMTELCSWAFERLLWILTDQLVEDTVPDHSRRWVLAWESLDAAPLGCSQKTSVSGEIEPAILPSSVAISARCVPRAFRLRR